MKNIEFLIELKKLLPENTVPWVVAALRQDEVVWGSLENVSFQQQALEKVGNSPQKWSPASLALLKLGFPVPPATLRKTPLRSLEDQLRNAAAMALEKWVTVFQPGEPGLEEAGLVALALRERFIRSENWREVVSGLEKIRSKKWRTTLACLFALIPNPAELLQELLPTPPLALHVFLSNPLPPEAQVVRLASLITPLPAEEAYPFIQTLNTLNRTLATSLSRRLIELKAFDSRPENLELTTWLHYSAGDSAETTSKLQEAIHASRRQQASWYSQLARQAALDGEVSTCLEAWAEANELAPDSQAILGSRILALLEAGQTQKARELLPDDIEDNSEQFHSNLLLASSKFLKDTGAVDRARLLAIRALEALPGEDNSDLAERSSQLSNLFMELSHSKGAVQAAELALQIDPNNPDLIIQLSRAQNAAGDHQHAAASARLAAVMAPLRGDIHRHLAKTLEQAGDWEAALREREAIVSRQASVKTPETSADLRALALCAIHAGNYPRALEVGLSAIDIDPKDGLAHALTGEALNALGKPEDAQRFFHQATRFTPHEPAPWLALSRSQLFSGQTEKAIETLRAATHTVPDNPAILLALGKTYRQQGSHSQALSILRDAYALTESISGDQEIASEIAFHLGHTLHQLGHFAEAKKVLESAHLAKPGDTKLAYTFAKTLMKVDEPYAALSPLTLVVQSNPEEPEPYLDYADALLRTHENPDQALSAVEKAIELSKPYSTEGELAQILLGEALAANHRTEEALQVFLKALDSSICSEEGWKTRLIIGMGKTALELQQTQTVLALLKETALDQPNNPEIFHLLSEAYLSINLPQDALETAQSALQLAPNDVKTLEWYGNLVFHSLPEGGYSIPPKNLEQIREAGIQALSRAVELAPERGDLFLLLGQAQIAMGRAERAREAFHKVLEMNKRRPSHEQAVPNLRATAKGYLALNDPQSALECLETARQAHPSPPLDLLVELISAYRENGELERALSILDDAVADQPQHVDLYLQKSEVLAGLGRPQAAIACLEQAINLNPGDASLHLKAAAILQKSGDLLAALSHAEQAIYGLSTTPQHPQKLSALLTGAELARSILQMDLAIQILESGEPDSITGGTTGQAPDDLESFRYFCLHAELALAADVEAKAIVFLSRAQEINPDHPRTLALLSRLTARGGDYQNAVKTLEQGLKSGTEFAQQSPDGRLPTGSLLALGEAAIDTGQWSVAVFLLRQAVECDPEAPFSQLKLAEALVLRAEAQQLSEKLDVVNHASGISALGTFAQVSFKQAIQAAERSLPGKPATDILTRWGLRGQAVFQPGQTLGEKLPLVPSSPEDAAALVVALRQRGDVESARKVARHFPAHPAVLAQLALALEEHYPEQALVTAQTLEKNHTMIGAWGFTQPLLVAFIAHLAQRTGDRDLALEASRKALVYWPDEPRWHAFLARIQLEKKDLEPDSQDISSAITHLEQAVFMEKKYIPHYIGLATAYMRKEAPDEAAQILNSATEVSPEHPEPWFYLAQANLATGDLEEAALCADKAIHFNPGHLLPILLRAEIALQADDPEGALELTRIAMTNNPHDSRVLLLFSRGLEALDRPTEAIQTLEKAIPLSEDPLPIQMERVRLLRQMNGPEAALQALQAIEPHHPDNPMVLAPLAEALFAVGKIEEAILVGQRAIQAGETQLSETEKAHLHLLLGKQLHSTGQLDQALHHLSQATKSTPNSFDAFIELGLTLTDRREYQQALSAFEKAIAIAPDDPRPYIHAGLALKENKDYRPAEAMFRKAAKLKPDDLGIHRQLGALVALNLVHNPT